MDQTLIFLIGMMGSGKSAVGRELAALKGWNFVDTDALIEKEQGLSIVEIFQTKGEPYFRQYESEMIAALCENQRSVISTGGGVVEFAANREVMWAAGRVVYLQAEIETLAVRLRGDTTRPLLMQDNPEQRLRELLAARKPYYTLAHVTVQVEGKSPEEIAGEIHRGVAG